MTVLAQKRCSAGTMSLRNDFLACPASILPLPEKRIVAPDAVVERMRDEVKRLAGQYTVL